MKIGLVLEGGASRTMFSCGVMDLLLENNIIADYVIGTSAGIAFGVSYASGQLGRNRALALNYMNDKRYMGIRHLINPKNKSYYNLDFVYSEIPNKYLPFDYEALRNFKGSVIAAVTNIKTGKAEYIKVPSDDKDNTVLRASCALPLMFQPIKIGEEKYLDGGLCDSIPYKKAFSDGCDRVIAILTREKGYIKGKEKADVIVKLLYSKFPGLVKACLNRPKIYNESISELEKLEEEGKALLIRPEKIQGIKRTESNPRILEELYNQGYGIGEKYLEKILKFTGKGQKSV